MTIVTAQPSQAKPGQPSQLSQAKKPRLGDTIIAKNNKNKEEVRAHGFFAIGREVQG